MPDGELKPLTRHKPDTMVENGYRGASKTMGFIARQWGSPSVKEKGNQPPGTMENNTSPPDVKNKCPARPVFSPLPMRSGQPATQPGAFQEPGTSINTFGSSGDQPLDLDMFLSRLKTHMFSISCMAFQDAWNVDLERVRDCCIHVLSPQGKLIPFCMYNLTDVQGRSLYRKSGPDYHDQS
ncbi:MAG: hypothetical protein QM498_15035 [Desulfobacterium sp.]